MAPQPKKGGMQIRTYVENVPGVRAKFAAAAAAASGGIDRATREAAEDLVAKTLPYVPLEEGTLRETGRVEKMGTGDYAVVFGGAEAPYAVYVHEDLTASHAGQTKAKFLEETYLENKDDYLQSIKDAALGGLG